MRSCYQKRIIDASLFDKLFLESLNMLFRSTVGTFG